MNFRSLQKIMIILALILLITGCASKAWVIQRGQNGGVIGYKGFRSSEAADNAIRDLIPCTNFKMISDELHTSQSTGLMPVPTSQSTSGTAYNNYGQSVNYQGTSTGTQYMPMVIDNSYRTFSYICETSNRPDRDSLMVESNDKTLYQSLGSQNSDYIIKPKIGTLSVQKVLIQCEAGRKAKELLRTTFDREQAKMIKEEKEIKQLQKKLKENEMSYSENVKEEKQIEIEIRIKHAQNTTKQKQEFIQELENELKAPILALIKSTVDELAPKNGYTLITESDDGSSNDITEEVILKVNEKSKNQK